jgi:alanyl-tRNA synthetase
VLGEEADRLVGEAVDVDGVQVVAEKALIADQKQLLDLANRVQSKLGGDSAIALGGAEGNKVGLVVLVSKGTVKRKVGAMDIVRVAAPVIGGGGGGREEMAQAGGKDPSKLDEALATARRAIEEALS